MKSNIIIVFHKQLTRLEMQLTGHGFEDTGVVVHRQLVHIIQNLQVVVELVIAIGSQLKQNG